MFSCHVAVYSRFLSACLWFLLLLSSAVRRAPGLSTFNTCLEKGVGDRLRVTKHMSACLYAHSHEGKIGE